MLTRTIVSLVAYSETNLQKMVYLESLYNMEEKDNILSCWNISAIQVLFIE
jgi:hypothetical protein